MAFKKVIKRNVGGYRYVKCPNCKDKIKIDQPYIEDRPYCSSCKKTVDPDDNFCGWCGSKFESDK